MLHDQRDQPRARARVFADASGKAERCDGDEQRLPRDDMNSVSSGRRAQEQRRREHCREREAEED